MKCLLMLATVFLFAGASLADSLLLHYSFDGSVADPNVLAYDYSGNFYDGIITGDPVGSTDVPAFLAGGNSWYGASDDWMDPNVPNPDLLKPTNYTIAFWAKPDSHAARVIVCTPVHVIGGNAQLGTSVYTRSGGNFRFYHNGVNVITEAEAGVVFDTTKWTHVALTVDTDTDKIALYVNGLLRRGETTSVAPMTAGFARICSSMVDERNPAGDEYQGYLDDFRIYDYALTANEIKVLVGIDNEPPTPEAGGIQSASVGKTGFYTVGVNTPLQLNGSYTDDGKPAGGTITTHWSVVDSAQDPNVAFDNPNALDPNVTFNTAGIYTLRLTVNDGELDGTDDIVIRAKDITDALQVHMKFDGDANDLTDDYYLNTVITGTPEFVPGVVGNALKLDAGDTIKFGKELGAETSISVVMWIQPDQTFPLQNMSYVASKRTHNTSADQGGWAFETRSDLGGYSDILYAYCSPGVNNFDGRLGYDTTWTGQWTHAVMTYDVNTGEQILYVDGAPVASKTSWFTSFDSVSDLQVGSTYFKGLVDELYIYDYVIDAAKVREIFTEGGNAPPVVTIDGEQAKIILPSNQVALSGSVYDENSYTVLWTVQEKPVGATVTFGDATSESTTATFDTAGDYVLHLTATDVGAVTGYDEFLVKVRPTGFDGLEAHITFENADPSLAVNSTVGIGYEGTIYGTPTAGTASSDAKVGTGALELFNDATTSPRTTTDYVTYNRFLGSDPALSVSVWFKCEDINTEGRIIEKTAGDSSGLGWFIRVRNGDGSISAMVGSTWGSGIDLRGPAGTIAQNEWVHAVLTFEDGVVRLYQSGALVREATGIQYSTGDIVSQMAIGRRLTQEDWSYFDGLIDEVRIYDYALSVEEVKSLYAGDGGLPWDTCPTAGLAGDLTQDCRVDMLDMAELGAGWQNGYTISTLESVALDWLECDDLDLSKCF